MPEIKHTTATEAIARALANIEEVRERAIRDLERAANEATADLQLRETAVAELSGLIERAKHAYVKDAKPYRPSRLVNLRLQADGFDVALVDQARGQSDYDNAPMLTCRPYRFWLLIEELPEEVPHAGA